MNFVRVKIFPQTRYSRLLLFILATVISLWPLTVMAETSDSKTLPTMKPFQKFGKSSVDSIIFEEPDLPFLKIEPTTPVQQGELLPKIAIIIDDMGHHEKLGDQLLDLDVNLTFSFLPYAPFTKVQVEKAHAKNREILIHLPMEAQDKTWDPGPNALYLADSPEKQRLAIEMNLAAVPYALGVNNHMGSRYTEDREAMRLVLEELKKRNLFFIDSFTTAQSVAMEEARKLGIKTARRHVFLDNIHTQENICRQLEKLITLAKQQGWAIGIGHPNKETLLALTKCHQNLFKQVQIVAVQELLD